MINKKELDREIIILDANIIGSSPFLMKELILKGYRIMAISSLCGKIEVECYHNPENTQEKAVQKREISERGLKII